MTEPSSDAPARKAAPSLRIAVLALAAANTVFWLFTFRFIAAHSNPKGDGMEWVAVIPFGALFLGGVLPPLLSGLAGRALRTASIWVLIASVLNAILFAQIYAEFNGPK